MSFATKQNKSSCFQTIGWNIAIAHTSVIYNNDIYLFDDADRRTESEIEHDIVRLWKKRQLYVNSSVRNPFS